MADCSYIFEFKIDKDGKTALNQIRDRSYYQKYQLRGKSIICIDANFNTKTRTIDDWQSEEVEPL